MNEEPAHSMPLDEIDVSNPELYENDTWRPYFERLRREDPVHYCANSAFGPYWSVTRFDDCVRVDREHDLFSTESGHVIGAKSAAESGIDMFIQMDPPKHGRQDGDADT